MNTATTNLPRMTCTGADSNPHMKDASMAHWRCSFAHNGKRMSVIFSMGSGHNGKQPAAKEVLNCLFMDASGADDSFDGFCSNFGYDTDSRSALRIFKQCQSISVRLHNLLGDDFAAVGELVQDA